ncbi:aerobic respiration two-component sensor histidine kinase ArcB [Psychromonas sp. Urea-02u-13]|uniref:aerobic respiration two-component sensor histidine kinase ArcB n=1 Tax=Psychromonas sp. Urea-02u-13 TaxID=2058326 RepID=UPI000C344F84|nr:aerobic respiration two-component sensor histidine kinase ArcB [Psychromonas sp. Urea-02u-13]PKG38398.1 aerobic respiration two-component sensor histidine kinase ArcB [Psychromonas sp. Urea-02u-13]
MSIFNLKTWVHYYVSLLKRLGAFRFSLLLALAIFTADAILQMVLAYYFNDPLDIVDISRSIILGLLITPWAVYFLTVVVGDLEEARQRLDNTVARLQVMLATDQQKTRELESEMIERQKSQKLLQEHTILLHSFLDTSPDLFFHRDLKGAFVSCNKAMELVTGRTAAQLIGLTPFDIYPDEYAQQVVKRDQKAQETEQEQIHEHWLHYPDGRQAFFEVRALPLYNVKHVCVGIIGFGRDITERKKHQESLEKASHDKTTFISTISHELRTPLNGIVGLSRMLLDEQLTTEQTKHLKTIHMSAITLGNIFNDIVDLDKLDRRRLNLVSNDIDMLDFISDLESLAFIQTEQKGLTLHFEQTDVLPNFIQADDTRLRQVLWNLVSNAVKFTEQGQVTIRCFCEHEGTADEHLCFAVQDSGIGIPADQLEKIFAMYYQVKGNRHATGTGIGLAVSKQIVDAMQGKITVTSEVDQGSTFKLCLPVKFLEQRINKPIEPSKLPALSILLVEDIELNVVVAKALLEKLGHQVDVAINGEQALQKVSEHRYQLILMDIQLPDMDGYQVTALLREKYQDLPPIVALTANIFSDKQDFTKKGMDDALGKPLTVRSFNDVVRRFFTQLKPQESLIITPDKLKADPVEPLFDSAMLLELMEFLPTTVMLDNIALFTKLMPDYMRILDSNMVAKDKLGIVSEAHKIKGAAGSVGLKRIQMLAQKVQSPELPAWWDNIDDWVELMKLNYESDITELKKWVVKQGR